MTERLSSQNFSAIPARGPDEPGDLPGLTVQVVPDAVYFLEAGFFVHGTFHTFFGGRTGN